MSPAATDITFVAAEQLRRRRLAAAQHHRVAIAARRGRGSRRDEPADRHTSSWRPRASRWLAIP
jgi:hypothetical protein